MYQWSHFYLKKRKEKREKKREKKRKKKRRKFILTSNK